MCIIHGGVNCLNSVQPPRRGDGESVEGSQLEQETKKYLFMGRKIIQPPLVPSMTAARKLLLYLGLIGVLSNY